MTNAWRWISIGLFLALSAFMLWFGYVYATVSDMLWFHAAAVPEPVRPQVKQLYFALMNLIGGASISFGVLTAYVALSPLRRGVRLAGTALTLTFVFAFGMAAITAEDLAKATGAPTSWHIMGGLMAAAIVAFVTHAIAARRTSA
jgi:hypothetical protein